MYLFNFDSTATFPGSLMSFFEKSIFAMVLCRGEGGGTMRYNLPIR